MHTLFSSVAVRGCLLLVLLMARPVFAAESEQCDREHDREVRASVLVHIDHYKALDQQIHQYLELLNESKGINRALFFYDAADQRAQFIEAAAPLKQTIEGPLSGWFYQMLLCNGETAAEAKSKAEQLLGEQRSRWDHLQQHLDAFADASFIAQVAEAQLNAKLFFGRDLVEPFFTTERIFSMFVAQSARYPLQQRELEALVTKQGLDTAIKTLGLDTSRKAMEQTLRKRDQQLEKEGICCALGKLDDQKLAQQIHIHHHLDRHSGLAVNMLLSTQLADNVNEAITQFKHAMLLFERSASRQFAIKDWDTLTPPEGDSDQAVGARWALQKHSAMLARYMLLLDTTNPTKQSNWPERYRILGKSPADSSDTSGQTN